MGLLATAGIIAAADTLSTGVRLQIDTIAGIYSGDRSRNYYSNYVSPNQIPSIDAMIAARNAGLMDERIFWEASILSGILPQESNSYPKLRDWAKAWDACIASTFVKPDPMFVWNAYVRGFVKEDKKDEVWKAYKFDKRVCQNMPDAFRLWPTFGEAVSMWHKDMISDDRYQDYVRKAGAPDTQARQDLQKLYQSHLTVGDYTNLWNRSAIFEPEWEESVRTVSGLRNNDMEKLKLLTSQVPGPADLVRFSVRDAFDDAAAERQGLDEEFGNTGSFQYWMECQGLGTIQSFEKPGPPETVDWPKLYWRSHWQLMSPTQSYVALQRLRPERIHLYQGLVPGLKPFTFDTLSDILRASDYVPEQRKWLAAISYAIPEQRVARELYQFDIIKKDEFIEMLKDRGLRQEDAESSARLVDLKKPYVQKKYLVPPLDNYDKALYREVIEAFRVGGITQQQLIQTLGGIIQNAEVINRIVASEQLRFQSNLIKSFTAMVKRSYFTGEISRDAAESTLTGGGVDPSKATSLVNVWSIQLDLPRKVASAGKLVDWYRHGSLSRVQLADRLVRLGYRDDTVLLTIAEGDRLIIEDEAKRKLAEQKAAKAKAKEAKAEAKERQAEANRYRTIAAVRGWFGKGIIPDNSVRPILVEMGVPSQDLAKWEADIMGVTSGD